ncbi:hypothetical protein FOPG_05717 [Fusarium oxysporum f. sp. conglutinans race 2 54008]|uniref:Uncharacterized protein n=3 Tax=Fusarium oxysporum TaxID=5507 RepID=F9GBH0_FUSOF|nr:hypothetical protein FOXB_16003 [Fusarium oxysporum f. sp. conglutinans Fo5176]EXA54556.1 hypothetical protein FOVG_01990 [Fusarium oxysporum f. sp. pisi HDV247]EXL81053.1 hypothetical protein FOPG_05717 [Fusarium oxysporum f. sp. conglutinans race 2 54008]KAI8419502.1 hypothetical protein FOFC_02091 [Fusarium oxysporum]WKT38401.1 hypothetical protein QSH57_000219 [Fusarium oxysporum f. sp. vasinfectum]
MTSKMTRGAWFDPIVVDDEPDVIKLEDTAPLACTAPLARSPSPLASTTIYLPVRFGTMRTRNQLCRPLEGLRNKSPDEFHLKIDQAYGHFCHKFRTTQQTYLDQISPIITTGNCFSAFTQIFPSANLTQVMQLMLRAEKRQTWALFHMYYINFSIFKDALPRQQSKRFYIPIYLSRDQRQGILTFETEVFHRCNWRRHRPETCCN